MNRRGVFVRRAVLFGGLLVAGCIDRVPSQDCGDCLEAMCVEGVCQTADAAPDMPQREDMIVDAQPVEDVGLSDSSTDALIQDALPIDATGDASPLADAILDAAAPIDATPVGDADPVMDAAPIDAAPECEISAPIELCDGIDNDCDGLSDEAADGTHPCSVDSVAIGNYHACAALGSREVKCWGSNAWNQLGRFGDNLGDDPGEMGATLPAIDLPALSVSRVAAGERHACVVLDGGDIACWGLRTRGVLAQARNLNPRIDVGGPALEVASGDDFSCALLMGGGVKCWGANHEGQLGQDDRLDRGDDPGELGEALPFVDLGADAVMIAAARSWACAVLGDGRVKCWGSRHDIGGRSSNEPDEMGEYPPPVALPPDRTVTQLSLNWLHACALLDNGEVKCWGAELGGRLGRGRIVGRLDVLPSVDLGEGRRATAIATGIDHTCAIVDGGVKCWGSNASGQLGLGGVEPVGLDPVGMGDALPFVDLGPGEVAVDIAAGGWMTCALLESGRLKCWGNNSDGQLGLEADVPEPGLAPGTMGENLPAVDLGAGRRARSITAGGYVTCAQLDNDALKCWGANSAGQLGQGDQRRRGDDPGEMGDALQPVDLGDDARVDRVWTRFRTCATLQTGEFKCWGDNTQGALGLGDLEARGDAPDEMRALPTIDLGSMVIDVATLGRETCAVLENGAVKCWGQRSFADAVGDEPDEVGPELRAEDLGGPASQLSSGFRRMCVLMQDGRVTCWGENNHGELGLGHTDDVDWPDRNQHVDLGRGRIAIALTQGYGHACALLETRQVKCWGTNFGVLGLGDRETRGDDPGEMGDALPTVNLGEGLQVSRLAAGSHFTCALLSNDQVKCWGAFPCIWSSNSGECIGRGGEPEDMGDALPAVDLGPGRVVDLATGWDHACALFEDGRVKCWGQNRSGQLGIGGRAAMGDDPGEMGAVLPYVDLGYTP